MKCCSALLCALGALLALLVALVVPQLQAPSGSGPKGCVLDPAGACKHEVDGPEVDCASGVFLALWRQPDLGLRHFHVKEKFAIAAEAISPKCTVLYSLACTSESKVAIEETWQCKGNADVAGPSLLLGRSWEVCASQRLNVLQSVIDLVWDVETPSPQPVAGCVKVMAPSELPELGSVRGSGKEQLAALVAQKQKVGGCAGGLRQPGDFRACGHRGDFAACDNWKTGHVMNLHLNNYASMAASWKTGETPSMWQRVTAIAVTGTLIVLNDMQNTEAFLAFSRSTCRTLLPFGRGFIDGTGYQHVINSITDPNMPRMFQMGANGGTEACFDPSMVIFQSSGTPEHSQSRRLWDDAVMSSMHLGDLPDLGNTSARGWMRRMRDRVGWKLPTEDEVGALIVPLLLERIWGKKPTAKEAETVAGYLSVGKVCIFGGMADSIPFLPSMIAAVRTAHVDFARDSPTADKLVKLLEEPGFAAVQKLYQSRGRPIRDVAVQGLADATMFAGVLGTTDMTFKCVKYTWQDPKHLRLFREKPTEYIWELMRVQAAVQGVSSVSTKARDDHMAGEEVHFPAGTPVAYSVSIANRDPIMFSKPSDMDFQRPWSEMGEMLSWNGRLKDVIARNYTGAPRFCPGHDLSVKLAAHVCAHLTRNL